METSNDALNTKVYAESLGYFKDEFVSLFLNDKKKMYPIINPRNLDTGLRYPSGNLAIYGC